MEYVLNFDLLLDGTPLRTIICAILDSAPGVKAMSINLAIYDKKEWYTMTQTEYDYLIDCIEKSCHEQKDLIISLLK